MGTANKISKIVQPPRQLRISISAINLELEILASLHTFPASMENDALGQGMSICKVKKVFPRFTDKCKEGRLSVSVSFSNFILSGCVSDLANDAFKKKCSSLR